MRTISMVILLHVFCAAATLPAQTLSMQKKDVVPVTIKDKDGTFVQLVVPESLYNEQCARRLYGTPPGVIGMFETLYTRDRRTESYETALREITMQPDSLETYRNRMGAVLEKAATSIEDRQVALEIVDYGAEMINKKYVLGGTLSAEARNSLATIGRKLNAAKKNPAFAVVSLALDDLSATLALTDAVAGALLLNALATDAAEERLLEIRRIVELRQKRSGKTDPALMAAIDRSLTNLRAARTSLGAFVVHVNDNLAALGDAAISLGSALLSASLHFSSGVMMWFGAPLKAYLVLRDVSNQWEVAQNAVSIATITTLIREETTLAGTNAEADAVLTYGEYAFYSNMAHVFDTSGSKMRDFLLPGQVNKDWAEYYATRGESVLATYRSLMSTWAPHRSPVAYTGRTSEVVPETPLPTDGSASAGPSLPTGLSVADCVSSGEYLYVVGGTTPSGPTDAVWFSRVASDGSLSGWQRTTSLPRPTYDHRCVGYNGYIYILGGYRTTYLGEVRYARVNGDGTLGEWKTTTSLRAPNNAQMVAAYNGFLYVFGGTANQKYYNAVYFAAINGDGSLGAWQTTSSMKNRRYASAGVVLGGYLYAIGGYDVGTLLRSVERAPINSDGSLGKWEYTIPLPSGRHRHAAVAFEDGILVVGGAGAGGKSMFGDVVLARLDREGDLGAWQPAFRFEPARFLPAAAFKGGFLYVIGGQKGTTHLSDVQVFKVEP